MASDSTISLGKEMDDGISSSMFDLFIAIRRWIGIDMVVE